MDLRYLYVDMNSYFASVEQQLRPELRKRPVAVVPVLAETTCCIAASYEAKACGVKTGTGVAEARERCPQIQFVEARPREYIKMHHRIEAAVESCVPVLGVKSIDEMVCRLAREHRQPEGGRRLAEEIKAAIRRSAGEHVRCSIGLAPNRTLAKMAADLHKPDGLTVIRTTELPGRLFELELQDFPGIGPRMAKRLLSYGITTVEQFCRLSVERMSRIWKSKLGGQIWWGIVRGEDCSEPPTQRRTVGHSRVLSPDSRHEGAARSILLRLTEKAAARLRHIGYWAGSLDVNVQFMGSGWWGESRRIGLCQDTATLLDVAAEIWERKPPGRLLKVGMVLSHLVAQNNVTPPLWEMQRKMTALSHVMDQANQQWGSHTLYLAPLHGTEREAPTRIAFTNIPDLGLADA
jgi:DNA polymerase-4